MSNRSAAPIAGPNMLSPDRMSPAERRAELGRILATGLIRLMNAKRAELSARDGDCSLHFRGEQSGTADPTRRRSA